MLVMEMTTTITETMVIMEMAEVMEMVVMELQLNHQNQENYHKQVEQTL